MSYVQLECLFMSNLLENVPEYQRPFYLKFPAEFSYGISCVFNLKKHISKEFNTRIRQGMVSCDFSDDESRIYVDRELIYNEKILVHVMEVHNCDN